MTDNASSISASAALRPPAGARPRVSASSFRRDILALCLCAAATIALDVGALLLAKASGMAWRESLLAALAAAAAWVALASAPMAAGGKDNWRALLRGCVPADASLVAMLVLWPLARTPGGETYLTLASVLKAYGVLAAMAVFSMAMVCCGRGAAARRGLALAAVTVLALCLAGPFWTSGLVSEMEYKKATSFVGWAVDVNPFYAVTAAPVERVRFFWHEWGQMYARIGAFRDFAPPPMRWYATVAIYAVAAVLPTFIAWARSRSSRRRAAAPCRGG